MVESLLFWIPIILLFHSYVLFPAILYIIAHNKNTNRIVYRADENLPAISILMSVYNEDRVIEQRIHNLFITNYPIDKLEILVGSDGSTDNTNKLLMKLEEQYPKLRIFRHNERQGKGNVLNHLATQANGNVLLLTDAKVEFSKQTTFQLVKNFKNQAIGIVGGNIVNRHVRKDGISIQEKQFMSHEIIIKYNEGRIWGTVMGVYGACFAIRKECFEQIPESFAVEDFYETLKTLEKGYKGMIDPDAICYEEVPNRIREEFRRKVRISNGNFQNMKAFRAHLKKVTPLSFCFFSHKIIRWIGPFLLIVMLFSNLFLLSENKFYLFAFALQVFMLIIPIIDFFLQKIHLHIITLRFVTHFYSMNLALLIGFIKYLKGVKTNVWEPTTRSYQKI